MATPRETVATRGAMMKKVDPRDELVDHLGAMRAFAISLTRNSALADDMVQDALVKAWTKIDTFQPGTNLRAWLFTIVRNTYYSHHRKARREVADPDGAFSGQLSQKPEHDGRLQMRDFNAAFAELNDEQREALVLIGAEGFTYEEAAETCGVAVGTIKSRVNRARVRLAELMGLDEDDSLEMTDRVTTGIVNVQKSVA
jgi:RNA polymerase sigma factor (sigma-70 family)